MALVRKENIRLEHPTEPGEYFVLRLPLSGGDWEKGSSPSAVIAQALVDWSLQDEKGQTIPINPQNVYDLDRDTFAWLAVEVGQRSGMRPEEKKENSNSDSTTGSEDEARSPAASLT